MLTKTIEWNGAKVTFHRSNIRDRILVNAAVRMMGIDPDLPDDFHAKKLLALLVYQAEIEGDIGMTLPDKADPEDKWKRAYNEFIYLDGGFYDEITNATFDVDRPLNDPDLLPPEVVPENLDEAAE